MTATHHQGSLMALRKIKVKDYMLANLVSFAPETDILKAIHELIEKRIVGAPVVDEHGNIIGFVSERECIKAAVGATYHEELAGPVSKFMREEVVTIDAQASIMEAAQIFMETPYKILPVLDDQQLAGLIDRHQVLLAIETLW